MHKFCSRCDHSGVERIYNSFVELVLNCVCKYRACSSCALLFKFRHWSYPVECYHYIFCRLNHFNVILYLNTYFFNDNIISYDGKPIHFTHNKDLIDYQVLRDVYTLKNCDTLFYCYSNVSLMSIMIGYTGFKEKILLN